MPAGGEDDDEPEGDDEAIVTSLLVEAGIADHDHALSSVGAIASNSTASIQTGAGSSFIPDEHLRQSDIDTLGYRVIQLNCKERGLKAKGKKRELVDVLLGYLEASGAE